MLRFFSVQCWKRPHILMLAIALLVLTVDQLTKEWVRRSLVPGESVGVWGRLQLTHSINRGIIFGISAPGVISIVLPILLICAALLLYYWYGSARTRLVDMGMGLFVGGALGNLIDRLRLGTVTDFIDIRLWGDIHWFTFNLADASVVVAVALFVVFIFGLRRTRDSKHR